MKAKKTVELKSCPFCGGRSWINEYGIMDKDGKCRSEAFRAECEECHIGTELRNDKQIVIDLWNKRV